MFGKFFLALLIFLLSCSPACASSGGRPLGMGGAFVALANDVNAIHWNPAGLSRMSMIQLSYTNSLRDKDKFDNSLIFGSPWQTGNLKGGFGLSYINSKKKQESHFTLAWAIEAFWDIRAGINTRYVHSSKNPSRWETDLALHSSSLHPLHLGIMLQNIDLEEIFRSNFKLESPVQINPGAAFYYSPPSAITIEISDFLDTSENYSVNIGWEHWFNNSFALRAGKHQDFLTSGFSFFGPNNRYDYAFILGDDYSAHLFGITRDF